MEIEANIVRNAIKQSNQRKLTISTLLLFIVMIVLVLGRNYWLTLLLGPKELTQSELLQIDSIPILPMFVTVKSDVSFDSGISRTSRGENSTLSDFFIFMQIEDSYLLVDAPHRTAKSSYTGALMNLPSELQQNILIYTDDNYPFLEDALLPIMLSTEDHMNTAKILFAGLLGITIFALLQLGLFLRRISNVNSHPIYKRLNKLGDPELIIEQIENDRKLGVQTFGKAQLSRNWIILPTNRDLDFIYLKDAVQMYERITTKYWWYVIPVEKVHQITVVDKYGRKLKIPTNGNMVHEFMATIQRRAPWIIKGRHQKRSEF